ncbi:flavohemoglobin expression-modulating QEGLA motif protein [Winogradskyella wichelsiae]|uniref:flavohemoglobin expression-modulating QEGLA motif protein n=1 Tax=Winogradskyella wichelsiae TaxID=2697007 RepID=UPI0015C8BA2B|nr:tyrosine/phenylalanine carboxypeptidase domain-containing protein [Winogradskyella wichelsiae]
MPNTEMSLNSMPTVKQLIPKLESGAKTVTKLPHGGFLFLEHDVPSLLIYRKKENDSGTDRLIRAGASYLVVGTASFQYYKTFIEDLTTLMSNNFGSFILLEIFTGSTGSETFKVRGPSHKLPVSLQVLKDELLKIKSRQFNVNLDVCVEQTKMRQIVSEKPLLEISHIKQRGATLIGLEVPPVFRDEQGHMYPLYFRDFQEQFIKAIQRAVFEFIRVQTTSNLTNYHALGKRSIHEEVFKIDKQLTEIENSYQFLLLVAPVNIQALRQQFFDSHFKKLDRYHYRLLPVDPDILKRKLYNLRIDEIDDPALSFLFDEKRAEIDQELTMLKERDTKNFFYSSIRLYNGLDKALITEAELILQNIPENHEEGQRAVIDTSEFGDLAKQEFDYFKEQDPHFNSKIHIRDDVNIMMVSKGELYLPSDYTMSKNDAKALIQHEIGTHALTYYNGTQQPLTQMASGLANYDALQEGIAVLSEYLSGGLSGNRLRILAGRVVAGAALINGAEFHEMFFKLYSQYDFTKERAFNITSRMFQGGGFLKDIIYLEGLVRLRNFLKEGGELVPLLSGKFALHHIDLIQDLRDRGLILPPKITPRYLNNEDFNLKIDKLKKGLPISKMI